MIFLKFFSLSSGLIIIEFPLIEKLCFIELKMNLPVAFGTIFLEPFMPRTKVLAVSSRIVPDILV